MYLVYYDKQYTIPTKKNQCRKANLSSFYNGDILLANGDEISPRHTAA